MRRHPHDGARGRAPAKAAVVGRSARRLQEDAVVRGVRLPPGPRACGALRRVPAREVHRDDAAAEAPGVPTGVDAFRTFPFLSCSYLLFFERIF